MSCNKNNMISDHTFQWDPISACCKFYHNTDVTFSIGIVSATKNTGVHEPKKDAYRNCYVCGKHYNYHIKK